MLLAHKDQALSQDEKEIGSEASFGAIDILIPNHIDYLRRKARRYLQAYFPDADDAGIDILANASIEAINPGTVLIRKARRADRLFLVVAGSVEYIETENRMQNLLPAGSIVGDHAVIQSKPAKGTYRTRSHVFALPISWEIFAAFLSRNDLLPPLRKAYQIIGVFSSASLFEEGISFPILKKLAGEAELLALAKKKTTRSRRRQACTYCQERSPCGRRTLSRILWGREIRERQRLFTGVFRAKKVGINCKDR